MVRTTSYINEMFLEELKEASKKIDATMDQLTALLISRIIRRNSFEPGTFDPEINRRRDFLFSPSP